MKFIFLNNEELNSMATSIISEKHANVTCQATFSEEEEMDVVEFYQNGENYAYDTLPLDDFLPELSKHLHQPIHSFDLMEVGGFGVGFVFFI